MFIFTTDYYWSMTIGQVPAFEFEIYVPDFNMQGDKFPFYITWKGKFDGAKITFTQGITPKTLNNVGVDSIALTDTTLEFTGVEVDGFVSGLFNGAFDSTKSEKIETLVFQLRSGGITYEAMKSIKLFRSDVRAETVPKLISLSHKTTAKGKEEIIVPDDAITLKNHGEGTALIDIDVKGKGINTSLPNEFEEFSKLLRNDLDSEIAKVIKKYPEHRDVLSRYSTILKDSVSMQLSESEKKDTIQDVNDLIDDNEVLREDLFSGILSAITRNLSFTNMLQSFVTYISSIKPSKVILLQPFLEIEVPEGRTEMEVAVKVTDLSWNNYDAVRLGTLTISSPLKVKFKVTDILNFSGEVK